MINKRTNKHPSFNRMHTIAHFTGMIGQIVSTPNNSRLHASFAVYGQLVCKLLERGFESP